LRGRCVIHAGVLVAGHGSLHERVHGLVGPGVVAQNNPADLPDDERIEGVGGDVGANAYGLAAPVVPAVGVVAILDAIAAAGRVDLLLEEVVAAVRAEDQARQQRSLNGFGQAAEVAPLPDGAAGPLECIGRHDRLVNALDDEPVLLGIVLCEPAPFGP